MTEQQLNNQIEREFVKVFIMVAFLRSNNPTGYWRFGPESSALWLQWKQQSKTWNKELWDDVRALSFMIPLPPSN